MSTNYIDQITDSAGTTHDISEGDSTRIFRATCSTAADTAAKVATLQTSNRNFSLATGVRVAVTFTYGNSATTPTLRVDGSSTGTAKTIAIATGSAARTTGNGTTYNTWGPYETVIFTYDGTYWVQSGSSLGIYNAYALANSKTANTGTITSVTTTAGTHSTINVSSGAASFNVPTKTSHLTNDSGFITSDTNTTYTLTNALSSHKFTWTLTAGGSGSGSTTTTAELVAGTGITLTDDTTNKKITIACSVTDTDTKVTQDYSTTNDSYPLLFSATSGVSSTASRGATTAIVNNAIYANPSTGTLTVGGLSSTGIAGIAQLNVTGTATFGDSVTMDDLTTGSLVVEGSSSFVNNAQFSTINGVTVGDSPKFTDTNTEVSTLTLASGSTAGTSLDYGGKYTLTAGTKTVSFTMPASDNTNYYHTSGSWSGLTYTATANGGAGALAFTIPTGTSGTTVALGNHTHDYSATYAAKSHAHGNITDGGDITATAPTIASGDQIVINDHSASKVTNGPTFDGSTTNTALTPKGTWESFSKVQIVRW